MNQSPEYVTANHGVLGCTFHETYNRALTMHAIHGLGVTDNVAYKHLGHGFFIEDGIETDNTLTGRNAGTRGVGTITGGEYSWIGAVPGGLGTRWVGYGAALSIRPNVKPTFANAIIHLPPPPPTPPSITRHPPPAALGNLGLLTLRSFSLLNTDITPATFWITNPSNSFINNRAAGSGHGFGFWYGLSSHTKLVKKERFYHTSYTDFALARTLTRSLLPSPSPSP